MINDKVLKIEIQYFSVKLHPKTFDSVQRLFVNNKFDLYLVLIGIEE